jgi:hypothetical protein
MIVPPFIIESITHDRHDKERSRSLVVREPVPPDFSENASEFNLILSLSGARQSQRRDAVHYSATAFCR